MLGRLRMTIDECLQKYGDFMNEIFHSEHGKVGKLASLALHGSYYQAHELEKVIKGLLVSQNFDPEAPLLEDPRTYKQGERQCKVYVAQFSMF